ncbi:CapM protein, capsular polysaccharide biosynthesis [Legionella birminghamensis]|uniref:CapM protein, capsular polysaccharide biosynthesis n=1 Tax=Legionella birminghamensis TaxID=28083 RepID=A0A378I692_9GAMM|nr:glycosyltransferase family 4 protein [Legionella birminghamensis]KTC68759.1 CapM protein, capsular polysaccharide biosynthesis [Legionella birminghamensis]STX30255.1 putative Starch synthase [Legionella birminghamensis]
MPHFTAQPTFFTIHGLTQNPAGYMRVLHFYKTYITDTKGGVEQFIYQLINSVSALGVSSEVLALSADKSAETVQFSGHTVHRAPLDLQLASTGFSFSAIRRFSELAKDADVIHYHFPWPFMDVVHFASRIKKPTVVTYHSDIVRQKNLLKLYQPLMHAFLRRVNRIVATSPNYLASSKVLNRYQNKTSIVPIGLDETVYPLPSDERMKYWRQRLGERFFLFVGMLRYYKGLHTLLSALPGLDYPVVIVGNGPEEMALKQQAEDLGLKQLHFVGSVNEEDKMALLKLSYAFVFPSHLRSEAFGISLLEAAMAAKPLISCEIGSGTSFINQNEETGLVIPPENPQALKNALQYLWNNQQSAEIMGRNARKRYLDCFTADKMAADYSTIYHQVVSDSSV